MRMLASAVMPATAVIMLLCFCVSCIVIMVELSYVWYELV